jgi:hypothetical protein
LLLGKLAPVGLAKVAQSDVVRVAVALGYRLGSESEPVPLTETFSQLEGVARASASINASRPEITPVESLTPDVLTAACE